MRFALPWPARRPAAAWLLVLLTLIGCGLPPAADPLAQASTLMASMSVEEKVGQLMVFAFTGTTVTPDAAQMVRDYHVGGVILFQQNLLDAARYAALPASCRPKHAYRC